MSTPALPTVVNAATVRAIHGEIIANMKLLQACSHPHDLERVPDPARPGSPFAKWRCKKCGGTMDNVRGNAYLEGLKHGLAAGEVRCSFCDCYRPGHATGGDDICTCK